MCVALVFMLSSATVSKEFHVYLREVLFAGLVQALNLANIILVAKAIPDETLIWLKQRFDRVPGPLQNEALEKAVRVDRYALSAAACVTGIAALLSFFVYQRHPHVPDEVLYLFQSRCFTNGIASVPAPAVPEAFSFYMVPYASERWYSIFPPGWPAVLALGVLCGVPWVVNPVLAGINMLLVYVLLGEIYGRRTARVALILLATSPWHVYMAMNFMSHTLTLTCMMIAWISVWRARTSGKTLWGWVGGGGIGMLSLVRPLDGLIVAGILGLSAMGLDGKRIKIASMAGLILGAAIVGSLALPYNKILTGDPMKSPLEAYYEEYFGPKANALGFGPERGLGWAIDPFPGHSPLDALVNANLNTFAVNIELFGWSTGSLFIIILFLFSGQIRRNDWLMFIAILGVLGVYSLYWFAGGPDFGARYWYLILIPLVAVTALGIQWLEKSIETGALTSGVMGTRITVMVLSLCFLSVVNFFPWRAIDKYYHYREMRPDIRSLAKSYDFGKSLVLIRGTSETDYLSAWVYNPLDPRADAPVYAWDKNLEVSAKVMAAYPDRPVWIVDGPSVTMAGYRLIEGPMANPNSASAQ
jgi:hypothetical protein